MRHGRNGGDAMKKPHRQPGVIYVLRNEQMTGVYRVGFTTHSASRRAAQIAQSQPYTLTVVGSVKAGNMYAEKRLHKLLAGKRIDGEWYKLADEDVERILSEDWLKSVGVVRITDVRRDYMRRLARSRAPYAARLCVIMAASEALDAGNSRLKVTNVTQLERANHWPEGAVKEVVYAARDAGEVDKVTGGAKANLYRFDIVGESHEAPTGNVEGLPLDERAWRTRVLMVRRTTKASPPAQRLAEGIYLGCLGRGYWHYRIDLLASHIDVNPKDVAALLDELAELNVLEWRLEKGQGVDLAAIRRTIWMEKEVMQ
jgi:hypothetical protein